MTVQRPPGRAASTAEGAERRGDEPGTRTTGSTRETRRYSRHALVAAMTVYLLAVAVVTLTPATEGGHSPIWYIMQFLHRFAGTGWVTEPRLELAANVVMFVPLGLLGVPLVGRSRWWWVIVAGVLLTCFIETAQLGIPGRVTDVRDIVANSCGAALGTAVCLAVYRLWALRRPRVHPEVTAP